MPFELGVFFGAKYLGTTIQILKNALIFERAQYTYQQYILDLNGIDTKAHENDPATAIRKIRDWLKINSVRTTIPGSAVIVTEYNEFIANLPGIVIDLGLEFDNLLFSEYTMIVEEVLREKLS